MLRQELLSCRPPFEIIIMAGFFSNLTSLLSSGVGRTMGSTALSSLSGQLNQSLSAHRNARLDYEMWKKKFDYSYEKNSPLAQRRRLEAAGLNPALMYQGGTGAGLSTSIGQSSVNAQNVDITAMASIANQTKVADAEANKLNAEADEIRRTTNEGNTTFPVRFEQLNDQAEITEFERQIAEVTANYAEQNASNQVEILKENLRIARATADKLDIEVVRENIRDNVFVNIDVGGKQTPVPLALAPYYLEISSIVQQINTLKEQARHWIREDSLRSSELNLDKKRLFVNTNLSLLDYLQRNRELDIAQQEANTKQFVANTGQLSLEFQAWLSKQELGLSIERLNFDIHQGNWENALKTLGIISGTIVGLRAGSLAKKSSKKSR